MDNTYDRFMIWRAEGMRINIVDSDDETFDDDNPLFGRTNGAPGCGICNSGMPKSVLRNSIWLWNINIFR